MTAPYASTRYPGAALIMAAADFLVVSSIVAAYFYGYAIAAWVGSLDYLMIWLISGHVRWPGIAASRVLAWAMDAAVWVADRWQGRRT